MRALMQRVQRGAVTVDHDVIGQIGLGWIVLVGVTATDAEATADRLAERAANLRCFSDNDGKMNLSALDIQAEMLVISQFTLYADTARGRRPSFVQAAPPDQADPLVNRFAQRLRDLGLRLRRVTSAPIWSWKFLNDGPVTIMLDSDDRR